MSDYFRPQSVQEASRLLRTEGDLTVLSGGTDLYPARTSQIAWGRQHPLRILDISAIDSLRGIEDRGSHWWIGATTTWTDIVRAPLPSVFDGLKAAAREIGGVQIQNRGTIAGNLYNGGVLSPGNSVGTLTVNANAVPGVGASAGKFKIGSTAQSDIERITSIWRECQGAYGGPWLFGEFSVADAMYAPVATRFQTYDVKLDPVCAAYAKRVLEHPFVMEWIEAAKLEREEIEELEVEF